MRNTYTQDCRSIQARYEKLRRVRSRELPARLLPPPLDERDEKEFYNKTPSEKENRNEYGKLKETKERMKAGRDGTEEFHKTNPGFNRSAHTHTHQGSGA